MMKIRVLDKASFLILVGLLPMITGAVESSADHGVELFSARIDERVCAGKAVQCRQLGEASEQAPARGNRAPVQLVVQLLGPDLQPVSGLTRESFFFGSQVAPAAGGSLIIADCPNCFSALPGGVYRIFVQPFGRWEPGTYTAQLRVDAGWREHRTLVQVAL